MRFRIASILLFVPALVHADQPQWGQRHSRNQVSNQTNLPESFDPASGRNVRWIVELGTETYATPTVVGGRIFIGTNNQRPRDPRHQGDRGVLLCLDEKTGRFLWQLVVPKLTGDIYLDWPRGGIVSSATVEDDRVYTLTNRGEVVCLDAAGLANGNDGPFTDEARQHTPAGQAIVPLGPTDADIIWVTDLVREAGIYNHDASHCSPLIHGDFLYINTSNGVDNTHRRIRRPDAPSLVVLDKRTGRIVARDDEGIGPRIFHCTSSSPALGEVDGRTLVFFAGGDGVVYAFEALESMPPPGTVATLRRVWRFDCDPAAPKEDVHQWIGNRREGPSNIKSMPVFHDGRLYVTVGGDLWWGKNQGWLKCIDVRGSGDITAGGEVWSCEMKRTCSTPAIHDGLVFVADASGRTIHCVDLATGRPHWTHQARGEIWASPLVADAKVYIGTRRGDLLVFAAAREKRLLSEIELDSPISASVIAANGVLYIATDERLYAVAR